MKILIVEDHSGMREMLRSLFSEPECHVCECADGIIALESYTNFQPDWVLMDIVMKNLDGISATRQIIGAFPQARILIVTDHDNARSRQAAHDAGAHGFVPKDHLLEVREIMGVWPPSQDHAVSH